MQSLDAITINEEPRNKEELLEIAKACDYFPQGVWGHRVPKKLHDGNLTRAYVKVTNIPFSNHPSTLSYSIHSHLIHSHYHSPSTRRARAYPPQTWALWLRARIFNINQKT